MRYICDFHVHSKYSRATSPNMDLAHIAQWAEIKGIDLVSTSDFTHPLWLKEIKANLIPDGKGLFDLKTPSKMKFILTTEISCIYKQGDKVRKIHLIVFAPSLEVVDKINKKLGSIGNIVADGRPILGLSAQSLTEIVLEASPDCFVVPAHAWTPWFAVFGSKSGFDSLEECFGPYTKYIKAIETGLSSDPAMNWRLSSLDNITLISNSDAHSPSKLGREANVLDLEELSYSNIIKTLDYDRREPGSFLYTIEFFPEEGKYHCDGHRECKIHWTPKETKQHGKVCSVCNRPVTVGVMHRVDDLADRSDGFRPKGAIPFKSLIPLVEVIGEAKGRGPATKGVVAEYDKLIKALGNEFSILLDIPLEKIAKVTDEKIAQGIGLVRQGKVNIRPGFDGEFGKISLFSKEDSIKPEKEQIGLFTG